MPHRCLAKMSYPYSLCQASEVCKHLPAFGNETLKVNFSLSGSKMTKAPQGGLWLTELKLHNVLSTSENPSLLESL